MLWHQPQHKNGNGGNLDLYFEKKSHELKLKLIKDKQKALKIAKSKPYAIQPNYRNERF